MKTVLITGANRGIGLEHARSFAARGLKVLATARFPKAAEELNSLVTNHVGKITVLRYDAADPESPGKLKLALKDTPLDLLLANAGVGSGERESFGSVDLQDVLELIRINSIAPLKLAEALTENVARSERKLMAFQSSQLGSIGNNISGGRYGYQQAVDLANAKETEARLLAVDSPCELASQCGTVSFTDPKDRCGMPIFKPYSLVSATAVGLSRTCAGAFISAHISVPSNCSSPAGAELYGFKVPGCAVALWSHSRQKLQ